jgi:hypothetical protein
MANLGVFWIDNPPLPKGRRFLRTQRVPRVPAAGPIKAGLTSQAIQASPALGYGITDVSKTSALEINQSASIGQGLGMG